MKMRCAKSFYCLVETYGSAHTRYVVVLPANGIILFVLCSGAFIVPYVVLMILVGRPMYYLELILGQFSSNSQVRAFGGFPLAKGEHV